MAEGAALAGMHLPAALAGALALRAGRTEARDPLREACPQPAHADRRVLEVAAALA